MRIIAVVLLLLILGVLFFLTGEQTNLAAPVPQSTPTQNDNSFKDLKIN